MSSDRSFEVAIIGGGVIGLACAHYLAAGGQKVVVIDKDKIGSGASHGNCGLLYYSDVIPLCVPGAVSHELFRTICGTSPLYIKPELDIARLFWLAKFAAHCRHSHVSRAARDKFAILKYASRLFRELFDTIDLSCDREALGLLSVFKSSKKWKGYAATSRFVEKFTPGYKRLNTAQALALEPALRDDIAGAWQTTGDEHVRPDSLMKSWKKHLESQGVTFLEFCDVSDIRAQGKKIQSLETSQGSIQADAFVLATGAWASQLGRTLAVDIPVEPGKGYSITMARPENCPAIPCMLYERNMVVTPWKSGYRLGGTMEFSGYDMGLTRHRISKLIRGAKEYLKEPLGSPVVEEWTSLRPMTYDDMPIIDRSPSQENLIVATGHGMLGLTLATATGKMVADLIAEKPTEIDLSPYSLKRF